MRRWKVFAAFLALFVSIPISLYLQFKVLKIIEASELMWFLFWVHWPVLITIQIILKLSELSEPEKK